MIDNRAKLQLGNAFLLDAKLKIDELAAAAIAIPAMFLLWHLYDNHMHKKARQVDNQTVMKQVSEPIPQAHVEGMHKSRPVVLVGDDIDEESGVHTMRIPEKQPSKPPPFVERDEDDDVMVEQEEAHVPQRPWPMFRFKPNQWSDICNRFPGNNFIPCPSSPLTKFQTRLKHFTV